MWMPEVDPRQIFSPGAVPLRRQSIRTSYYTSMVGDSGAILETKDQLFTLGFSPNVFKKGRQSQKAKGVDIALTKDMLSHAYQSDYDPAILVGGDRDYVPLVEKVKSLGKRVHIAFFDGR